MRSRGHDYKGKKMTLRWPEKMTPYLFGISITILNKKNVGDNNYQEIPTELHKDLH